MRLADFNAKNNEPLRFLQASSKLARVMMKHQSDSLVNLTA
jgi:hypothetical protein